MGRLKEPNSRAAMERALKFAPNYEWKYEIVWKNATQRSYDILITAIKEGKIAAQSKVSDLMAGKDDID